MYDFPLAATVGEYALSICVVCQYDISVFGHYIGLSKYGVPLSSSGFKLHVSPSLNIGRPYAHSIGGLRHVEFCRNMEPPKSRDWSTLSKVKDGLSRSLSRSRSPFLWAIDGHRPIQLLWVKLYDFLELESPYSSIVWIPIRNIEASYGAFDSLSPQDGLSRPFWALHTSSSWLIWYIYIYCFFL